MISGRLVYKTKDKKKKKTGESDISIIFRPVEMKTLLGGLQIMKYCRPPWLADEKILHFKSSKTAKKT